MITATAVKDEVVRLAAQYPNARYVQPDGERYFKCSYTDGSVQQGPTTPGCIVGQALFALDAELLYTVDDEVGVGELFQENPEELEIDDAEALEFLELVQLAQDNGNPWSAAIDAALKGTRLGPQSTLI